MKKIIRNFALAFAIVAMPALLFSCKSNEPDSGSSSPEEVNDTTTVDYYVYALNIPSISFSDETKYESGLTEAQQAEEINKIVSYTRTLFNGLKSLSSDMMIVESPEAMPDSVIDAQTIVPITNYMYAFQDSSATTIPCTFYAMTRTVDITECAIRQSLVSYLRENYPEYTASESLSTYYLLQRTVVKGMQYRVKMVDNTPVRAYIEYQLNNDPRTINIKPATSTAE